MFLFFVVKKGLNRLFSLFVGMLGLLLMIFSIGRLFFGLCVRFS